MFRLGRRSLSHASSFICFLYITETDVALHMYFSENFEKSLATVIKNPSILGNCWRTCFNECHLYILPREHPRLFEELSRVFVRSKYEFLVCFCNLILWLSFSDTSLNRALSFYNILHVNVDLNKFSDQIDESIWINSFCL